MSNATFIPIMAQYVEPGMVTPFGRVKNVEEECEVLRITYPGTYTVVYTSEKPVFIEIDLEHGV